MSALLQTSKLQTTFDPKVNAFVQTTTDDDGITQVEHWRRQNIRPLGRGAYGAVFLEHCIEGHPEVQLRAVKQIEKHPLDSKPIDCHREVEAILRFSQRKYRRRFVQSFGWYEDPNFIFIAMEHFLLGDLQRYLEEPLPELESRKITLQVLGALFDMHQNAFAHRDIKPKNILVSSMPPTGPWLVKLSDFGISKRIEESTTATKSWTRAGTDGYMAPELFGFGRPYERPDPQAADMWALGVVAHQMLTAKPCFENLALLSDYGRLPDNFPAGALRERGISDDAVHFIKSIMQFQAGDRLTADQALLHEWVNRSSIEAAEDSSDTHIHFMMQIPEPSGRWDTTTDARGASGNSDITAIRGNSIDESITDTVMSDTSRSDPTADTRISARTVARPMYFILKSDNERDIETSIAHKIWCCGMTTNKKLSKRYNNTAGPIFLIFSVNKSRQFCGVAEMRSPWDPNVTSAHWVSHEYRGGFHVEWLSFELIKFDDVSHLRYRADNQGITINQGQQFLLPMCQNTGLEMMRRFGVAHLVPQLGAAPTSG